ncbi:hypothetical protein BKA70DRAFT_1453500 [Coprinopsis sp. MPI-PUGE-AT-0042]|nr:hypothetical protein BKA70DRAFT_1453500 [Coprinopsis sp. MPI-PUGE-AT-0042]
MEKRLTVPHFGHPTALSIAELQDVLPSLKGSIPTHLLPQQQASRSEGGTFVNPNALLAASPTHRHTRKWQIYSPALSPPDCDNEGE